MNNYRIQLIPHKSQEGEKLEAKFSATEEEIRKLCALINYLMRSPLPAVNVLDNWTD